MKTWHSWGLVLILLILAGTPLAQELTTQVYPSEDELAEALERGEIDSAQYYYLWQLHLFGLDSSNVYLEDVIPNLTYFLPLPRELSTPLEQHQRQPFVSDQPPDHPRFGRVQHRWYRALEQGRPWAFNTNLQLEPTRTLDIDLSLRRSRAGTERVVRRSVTYRPENSALRGLTLGNFTTRLGMGSILGHPGKLVDYPDKLDAQSLLFPDYGGYNGLLADWRLSGWKAQTLAAISRGEKFELITAAATAECELASIRLEPVFSLNRLRNRVDDSHVTDLNFGLTSLTRYDGGYLRSEISYQFGDAPSWRAALLEGRHRFRSTQISYALWSYGNHLHDLTAGSKSAILRHQDTISTTTFAYSSRRVGQSGGLLKTIVKLSPRLDLSNNLVAGYHQSGSDRFQWHSALNWQSSPDFHLRLDLLLNNRHRTTSTSPRQNDLRIRLQSRFTRANCSVRSYIGLQTRSDQSDYVSLLIDTRLSTSQFGRVDLWVDLGRWNPKERMLEYYYMYLQLTQHYLQAVEIGLKLAHRYARNYTSHHQTSVSITTTVTI
ncbi:hypothetical protein GF356_12725 [candidate division GN15 bacterium]|nr:hypothetical protein [candidate division GN15 bacterium]